MNVQNQNPGALPTDLINENEYKKINKRESSRINHQVEINNQPNEIYLQVIPVEADNYDISDWFALDASILFLLNLFFPFFGYIYYCCRYSHIKRKKAVFWIGSIPVICYLVGFAIFAGVFWTTYRYYNPYYYPYYPYYYPRVLYQKMKENKNLMKIKI